MRTAPPTNAHEQTKWIRKNRPVEVAPGVFVRLLRMRGREAQIAVTLDPPPASSVDSQNNS